MTPHFFEPWADWLLHHFQSRFGLEESCLPSHLASRRVPPNAEIITRVVLAGSDNQIGSPIRRIRATLVSNGEQLQALNVAVYPAWELGPVPIFGADLLSFNSHQRLLFGVDWAPMSPEESYSREWIEPHVAHVRAGRHGSLATMPSGKFYGERPEFFSPQMFFARPEDAQALRPKAPLWEVFCEYATQYSDMLKHAQGDMAVPVATTFAEQRQAAYDQWHAERDPALSIFRRLFGSEWTGEYVDCILFPGRVTTRTARVDAH